VAHRGRGDQPAPGTRHRRRLSPRRAQFAYPRGQEHGLRSPATDEAMTEPDVDPADDPPPGRPPRGAVETIVAHCRPGPAVPALLVMSAAVLLPALSALSADTALGWRAWAIPAGIVASCGLAVAAGFCSLFPPAAWIALAVWTLAIQDASALPAWHGWLLWAGIAASATMLVGQLYRVRTGRFVPTVDDAAADGPGGGID